MNRSLALLCLVGCGGGSAVEPRRGGVDPVQPWPAGGATGVAAGLVPARTFVFTANASAVLPGDSTEVHPDCDGRLADSDRLDRVAVRAVYYQNNCYTDGAYNARDYLVEIGVVTSSDGSSYDAFRVHPPRSAATEFLASHHFVYYRLDAAEDHTLYALEAGGVIARGRLAARDLVAGDYAQLPIDASALGAPAVYFVSAEPVSSLTAVSDKVAGALLAQTALGDVELYQHSVDGIPFDTRTGFDQGPSTWGNTYSNPRHFFPVELVDGTLGVVWQDTSSSKVWVTTTDPTLTQQRGTAVENPGADLLAAAASDGASNVYLLFVQAGDGAADNVARTARLVRVELATGAVAEESVDTSPDGLNLTTFGSTNVASMAYANGRLGLTIGRTMHRSPDGLNHQGGIAVVFDAATLKVVINHGQTSGHSFENVLTARGGAFHAIDLGDNYPRGVHLHRFDDTRRDSAIVYTFKTQHGTSEASPAGAVYPVYAELSGAQTFYQWSNDNATYTELGGLVEDADGYTVVFTSEESGGRALDNRRTGASLNDPRNIGLVRVRHDFEAYSTWGSTVSDQLVLSSGASETGGFYAFGGDWTEQRNAGVVWLTGYDDLAKANASRVRAVGLADGNVVILWEEWTPTSYVTTWGLKVDPLGNVVTSAVELGAAVRLGRRDDVLVRGNDVYLVGGRAAERALEIIVLRGP